MRVVTFCSLGSETTADAAGRQEGLGQEGLTSVGRKACRQVRSNKTGVDRTLPGSVELGIFTRFQDRVGPTVCH